MGFLEILGFGKKSGRTAPTRRILTHKPKLKKSRNVESKEKIVENPLITVSRQLTQIQESINSMDTMARSGFQGLRNDHHRILEEQLSKKDFESFRKEIESRRDFLQRIKGEIEQEITLLDIDKKIIELLQEKNMQSAAVAKQLGIARQYASIRLNALLHSGLIESLRDGREIFYRMKKQQS